ncbi:hypothetical protein CCACVL1_06574 [Corchorus capsularis]|uniref:Uncharacterized protein n=1 Tax=Corchorus capsularis TaxID=210143 RepID=A0A1R3JEK1_COCAP|nr:hypothetical protein CCACVL1_06574 [Corchorus capsularis]
MAKAGTILSYNSQVIGVTKPLA